MVVYQDGLRDVIPLCWRSKDSTVLGPEGSVTESFVRLGTIYRGASWFKMTNTVYDKHIIIHTYCHILTSTCLSISDYQRGIIDELQALASRRSLAKSSTVARTTHLRVILTAKPAPQNLPQRLSSPPTSSTPTHNGILYYIRHSWSVQS